MRLALVPEYERYGLGQSALDALGLLGDMILGAGVNVTAVKEPDEVERVHFLDSLSLLKLAVVRSARHIADVGSGGGLPGLVLALASPTTEVTAIESVKKKCEYIERTAAALGLKNVRVICARAEEHGMHEGRAAYDVAVSRAVAQLPVLAEYSLPLLKLGGHMVAMKGAVSDQELTQAVAALGILGADGLEMVRMEPFPGSRDHLAFVAKKTRPTPCEYPRRAGMAQKRPLGRPSR